MCVYVCVCTCPLTCRFDNFPHTGIYTPIHTHTQVAGAQESPAVDRVSQVVY